MSQTKIALRYAQFLLKSKNEHGIHPPFLFELYLRCLKSNDQYYCFEPIEMIRKQLLRSEKLLDVQDLGAQSIALTGNQRKIKDIAATSLSNKKQAQQYFRLVHHLRPNTILDLGTSLGITTAYLAKSNSNTPVYTFEGNTQIAREAKRVFERLNIKNIEFKLGNIDDTLPRFIQSMKEIDCVFFDANHQLGPTVHYFNLCKNKAHAQSVFIFDDIHWSPDMEQAWKIICHDPLVTLSVDAFHFGLVFFNPDLSKQHFCLRA